MDDTNKLEEWITAELELRYALEMTKTMLRSGAVITDRDVVDFAAILGIGRKYPVTRRWPHTWTCRQGTWAQW